MAKKTKAAIKWTLTVTTSADPVDYPVIVDGINKAQTELVGIGHCTVTGPTIVRVEV